MTTMADWQMARNARVKLRASGECGLSQMCCELPYGRRNWTGAQRCIGHRGTQDALGQCMHWARCPDGELACSVSRCACCAASTVQLRTATENRHKCSFMMSGGVVGVSTGLCAEAPGRTFDSSAPALARRSDGGGTATRRFTLFTPGKIVRSTLVAGEDDLTATLPLGGPWCGCWRAATLMVVTFVVVIWKA